MKQNQRVATFFLQCPYAYGAEVNKCFHKALASKYLRLQGPHVVCCRGSALLWQQESSHYIQDCT